MLTVELRHRELTQEISDIGDEVATHIENLSEAIADFDVELVDDCLAEFAQIIFEARRDARVVVTELTGLRRALISGARGMKISAPVLPEGVGEVPEPSVCSERSLRERFPVAATPVAAGKFAAGVNGRTEQVVAELQQVADWVADRCQMATAKPSEVFLPLVFSRTRHKVEQLAAAWHGCVAEEFPVYCKTMRGQHPPEFLVERARVDMVVARVKAKLAAKSAHQSGGLVG